MAGRMEAALFRACRRTLHHYRWHGVDHAATGDADFLPDLSG